MQKTNPWIEKIPWNKKWQPTLVFLPGKSHGQRSLVSGLQPMGPKESDKTEHTGNDAKRHFQTNRLSPADLPY